MIFCIMQQRWLYMTKFHTHVTLISLLLILYSSAVICGGGLNSPTECIYHLDHQNKKYALCSELSLRYIPSPDGADVITANFDNNFLQEINDTSLTKWSTLEVLTMINNKIGRITTRAFEHVKQLKSLNLAGNFLTTSDDSFPSAAFNPLKHLQFLNLAANRLISVPNHYFVHLESLQSLNISYQALKIDDYSFYGLRHLEVLDMTSCHLRALSEAIDSSFKNMTLKKIFLGGQNQWECDCKLRWLKIWFTQAPSNTEIVYKKSAADLSGNKRPDRSGEHLEPVCEGPQLVKGLFLFGNTLQITDFQCLPIAFTKPEVISVHTNVTATLSCKFHSDPKITVIWIKDGTIVKDSRPRVKIKKPTLGFDFRTEIEIFDTIIEDSGEWVCKAQNRRGEAKTNFTLIVNPPQSSTVISLVTIFKFGGILVACIIFILIVLIFVYCCYYKQELKKQQHHGLTIDCNTKHDDPDSRLLALPQHVAIDEMRYEPDGSNHTGSGPYQPMMTVAAGLNYNNKAQSYAINDHEPLYASSRHQFFPPNRKAYAYQQGNPPVVDICPLHGSAPLTQLQQQQATAAGISCPIHGEVAASTTTIARSSARSQTPHIGPLSTNQPYSNTLPHNHGNRAPCPLHGDLFATLQRQLHDVQSSGVPDIGIPPPPPPPLQTSTDIYTKFPSENRVTNQHGLCQNYILEAELDDDPNYDSESKTSSMITVQPMHPVRQTHNNTSTGCDPALTSISDTGNTIGAADNAQVSYGGNKSNDTSSSTNASTAQVNGDLHKTPVHKGQDDEGYNTAV